MLTAQSSVPVRPVETEGGFSIERRTYGYIKGIAILMMLVHHFYGFPLRYVAGVSYPATLVLTATAGYWIEHATRLCVALFAFLTGYAAALRPQGFTFRYGMRKSFALLERYWIILLCVFLPLAMLLSGYEPTASSLILNMLGVRNTLIEFCWYVYFFVFSMAVLPLMIRAFSHRGLTSALIPILLLTGLSEYFSSIRVYYVELAAAATECFHVLPVLWVGYCFGENDWFTRLRRLLPVRGTFIALCGFAAVLVCRIAAHDFGEFSLDCLYAPLAVYFLSAALQGERRAEWIRRPLAFLGRHAANLWFLHALFFSECLNGVFQRIVFLPAFPPLVIAFAVLLCLPLSLCVNLVIRRLDELADLARHPHSAAA